VFLSSVVGLVVPTGYSVNRAGSSICSPYVSSLSPGHQQALPLDVSADSADRNADVEGAPALPSPASSYWAGRCPRSDIPTAGLPLLLGIDPSARGRGCVTTSATASRLLPIAGLEKDLDIAERIATSLSAPMAMLPSLRPPLTSPQAGSAVRSDGGADPARDEMRSSVTGASFTHLLTCGFPGLGPTRCLDAFPMSRDAVLTCVSHAIT